MAWFNGKGKTKVEEKTRIGAIVESSSDAIAKVHLAGRYPLSILVMGVAVIIVALIIWQFVAAVSEVLPWLLAFASLLAVLGVVMYMTETRRSQKMIEKSLDQYHDFVARAFDKYLAGFEKIDGLQWQGILDQLDKIYARLTPTEIPQGSQQHMKN